MSEQSVAHATFVIEHVYAAPPARVFAAFADPAIKRRWFAEGEGWVVDAFEVDFRSGGSETSHFRQIGGPAMGNDTHFLDIVPDRRIVSAYTMIVDGTRISASLGTVDLLAEGSGTRLVYTEQAAFLDGQDQVASREAGWRELLEGLGAVVDG